MKPPTDIAKGQEFVLTHPIEGAKYLRPGTKMRLSRVKDDGTVMFKIANVRTEHMIPWDAMEPYKVSIAEAARPATDMTKREFFALMIYAMKGVSEKKACNDADSLIDHLSKTSQTLPPE